MAEDVGLKELICNYEGYEKTGCGIESHPGISRSGTGCKSHHDYEKNENLFIHQRQRTGFCRY